VKSNNKERNNNLNSNKQVLQNNNTNNLQKNENVSALKDGFRYDFNDPSEFKDNKMS
jgi:hypothetical protein